jgi:hypothetical protein
MKNSMAQVSLFVIAFVALSLLMSYTRPAAEEPKQYIVVTDNGGGAPHSEKFEAQVNQKLAEGWHLQGGVCMVGPFHIQAMVK